MATTATNISEARKNLKKYTDDVAEYQDTLIITKPKNKNVVVISEAEYRSMKETLFLLSSENNHRALKKSLSQLHEGNVKTLSAEEWQKLDEDTE